MADIVLLRVIRFGRFAGAVYVAGASIAANLLDVHSLLSSGDAVLVDWGDTARIASAIEATNKALLHKLARERTPLATR